jgi:hypothetical protein
MLMPWRFQETGFRNNVSKEPGSPPDSWFSTAR